MFFYSVIALFFGCNILFSCQEGFVDDPNEYGGEACVPSDFVYYQSTQQGFYLFQEVVVNGYPISNNDWVAAFKGDVCVGSTVWDISQCNNGVCALPVMGDNGSDLCDGYMQDGDIPSFRIYDVYRRSR